MVVWHVTSQKAHAKGMTLGPVDGGFRQQGPVDPVDHGNTTVAISFRHAAPGSRARLRSSNGARCSKRHRVIVGRGELRRTGIRLLAWPWAGFWRFPQPEVGNRHGSIAAFENICLAQ